MNFKIGDRVRIVCRFSPRFGKVGTIWKICEVRWDLETLKNGYKQSDLAYCVDIDGLGKFHPNGYHKYAYTAADLRPLTDPKCTEFIESLKLLAETEEKV